jgi:hypothetical protein
MLCLTILQMVVRYYNVLTAITSTKPHGYLPSFFTYTVGFSLDNDQRAKPMVHQILKGIWGALRTMSDVTTG